MKPSVFIVIWSTAGRKYWSAHETLSGARRKYDRLLKDSTTNSASIVAPIESTDYDTDEALQELAR